MDPAVGVLAVIVLATFVLHARTLQAHAVERERLTQLAVAKDGREYAQIRKASEAKPPAAVPYEEPEVLIGQGG